MAKYQPSMFGDEPVHVEKRDDLDRYYTPEWATRLLVDYLGGDLAGSVWEPACGADWIGRVLRMHSGINRYLGTDIDPDAIAGRWDRGYSELVRWWGPFDFLNDSSSPGCKANWIVTNPPYNTPTGTATDFVRKAIEYRSEGNVQNIAMLLRLSWMEPCDERKDIWSQTPPSDVLVLPRVHYVGAGNSNSQTSAWFIWRRNGVGTRLEVCTEKTNG